MKKITERSTKTILKAIGNEQTIKKINETVKEGADMLLDEYDKIKTTNPGSTDENRVIRQAYVKTTRQIDGRYPAQEFEEGSPELADDKLKSYAKSASHMRTGAKLSARGLMPNHEERKLLHQRDKEKYGSEDGVFFDEKLDQTINNLDHTNQDEKESLASMLIYYSSAKTNTHYNKKYGVENSEEKSEEINSPARPGFK